MTENIDRLYELLPAFYRIKDAEQGYPLRALCQVIAEQVNVVEDDIDQLYDNWFIETCQDWVVPYIGDLIGYRQEHDSGGDVNKASSRGQKHNKILVPRLDVANAIQYRRRKGTLALLDPLAKDITGWPSYAVELRKSLGFNQNVNHLHIGLAKTVNFHEVEAMNRMDGPFNGSAHTVDLRTFGTDNKPSYNIPGVGLFVWRLKDCPVTMAPAYRIKDSGTRSYTFNALGNDTPLYTHPDTGSTIKELQFPMPIKRWAFKAHKEDYYGPGKSIQIWVGNHQNIEEEVSWSPIDSDQIEPADLSKGNCIPADGFVAVDPELGRIAFSLNATPAGVKVSYYYGSCSDIGGGEYDRTLSQPADNTMYQVGPGKIKSISEALLQWQKDKEDAEFGSEECRNRLMHPIVEIIESGIYYEAIEISLDKNESLQIRAANKVRPILHVADKQSGRNGLNVTGLEGSNFTLDGFLIAGGGMRIEGDLAGVTIRHSTFVPDLDSGNENETKLISSSLELLGSRISVEVDRSIMGLIEVYNSDGDPISLDVSDSILDATDMEGYVVFPQDYSLANVEVTIRRSTIIGRLNVHAIKLAEDSIFFGHVKVARRQQGCMRFCYVLPYSRTPRLYACQPNLAIKSAEEELRMAAKEKHVAVTEDELAALRSYTEDSVQPRFTSRRFGNPAYCQLAYDCALEIKRGAEDESEMGVFHDLYQPQREASLRIRLDEFTPAEIKAGIVFMS